MNRIALIISLTLASALSLQPVDAKADYSQDRAFGGFPVDAEYLRELVGNGYIPTRPPMSDFELAQKLNLELPELAQVKAAVEKKDAAALQAALAAYLNSRLAPAKVTATGRAAANAANADKWLAAEISFPNPYVKREPRKFPLGQNMNWWLGCKGCESGMLTDWYFAPPLAEAYQSSGDPRYAERLILFARDFYPKAGRPPAQRPATWLGCGGPWRSGSLHTRLGYMAVAYRGIGGAACVTDADRVMFLKMFWEHCDALYQLADRPMLQNFAGAILKLVDAAVIFPEFRDQPKWLDRSKTFFGSMVMGMTSEDGGPLERSGYGFGVIIGLKQGYTKFRDAGVTPDEAIRQRLEKAFEYLTLFPSPTWLCPVFGHGTPISLHGHMGHGRELFPQREDFAYVVSAGKEGKPPARTARDFWNTGLAMMRSDWTTNALYMAFNYNGCPWGADQHPEMLTFALQAHGRFYMSAGPGTTEDYGHPEEASWDEQTIAANTVTVDHESQKTMDNGGRMESWENFSGFGYLAAVSRGYEWIGVQHRRAVLFMKPLTGAGPKHGYWLIYDRLDGDGRPHTYRWMGHFQPTELKVDAFTKLVETSAVDGNRLYLKSAEPYGHFGLEQASGPLQAVTPDGGNVRTNAPYISLVRSSADPVAFKVFLYPATKADGAPVIEPWPARDGVQPTPTMPHQEACSPRNTEEAVGFRVTQGTREDFLAIAQAPALRTYGRFGWDLVTDGEVAIVRRDDGETLETGLVRGQRLSLREQTLIEASPAIAAVHVRYVGDKAEITTRGVGKLSIAKLTAKSATLNGQPVIVTDSNGLLTIAAPSPPSLTLSAPIFSTDAKAICHAVGVPYGAELGPNDWGAYSKGPTNSVLVKWNSSLPSDAEVEYREAKSKTWKRSVCGEPLTNHQFAISEIEPGKSYEFRITCRSEAGALATATANYRAKASK